MMHRLGIALAVAILSAACSAVQGHSCVSIAFVCNQTQITLQSPNDAWAPGTYTLALSIDGSPAQCTMQIPDPPPANGMSGFCGLGTMMTLKLATVDLCPPPVCDQTACRGSSCTPIPGRFQMSLVIPSLTKRVGLDLSIDGAELMNVTIAPVSKTTGDAECGFCTKESATVSLSGG